jgi:hypothetical protein
VPEILQISAMMLTATVNYTMLRPMGKAWHQAGYRSEYWGAVLVARRLMPRATAGETADWLGRLIPG